MGMMDYFRSSYDLGEQFTNIPCQTKDIETFSWDSSKLLDDRGKQIADYVYPSPMLSHGRLKGTLRIERLFDVLAEQQARIEQLEDQINNTTKEGS